MVQAKKIKFDTAEFYAEMISNCSEAIAKNKLDAIQFVHRAGAHGYFGNSAEEMADLNTAIGLGYQSPDVFIDRGMIFVELGQLDKAEADFEQAVALDQDYASSHYCCGMVHNAKKEFHEAIESFSKAIELCEDIAYAYDGRSVAYAQIGESALAQADSDKFNEWE